MNDILTPQWIKDIKAENDQKAANEFAEGVINAAASNKIYYEGPNFWRTLLKELAIQTEALKLIEVTGRVDVVPNQHNEQEQIYRVEVGKSGHFPKSYYLNLFYTGGQQSIRLYCPEEGEIKFDFCLLPRKDGIGVTQHNDPGPIKNVEQFADFIVHRAYDLMNKGSGSV